MNLIENQEESSKKTATKDNANDFDNSLRYTRCLLRLLGIWALVESRPTRIEYVLSKRVLIPFVSISMMSLTVPICCYVIARPIDRLETIVLLGPITKQIGNILVYFAMIVRSVLIKICIEHVELDWKRIDNSKEHDIMTRYSRLSHTLSIACILFVYTGGISYALIMPLLSGNVINEMNVTIRPRPFPGTEIFFDVQANVLYEIVFFVNFISALRHNTVSITLCVLAILFVSHACGQIRIVTAKLDGCIDRANEDKATLIAKNIGSIIRKHVRLLKFAKNIEKSLREMILVEAVATTLVICFIEYDVLIILESDSSDRMGILTYVMIFVSFAFNLFLYCQFGEVLKSQCEKIGKKAYLIDWYAPPGRSKLSLIMIINMSNYPCKLTAGGTMDLSIVNFASILKTSFAYFNMMRAMGR